MLSAIRSVPQNPAALMVWLGRWIAGLDCFHSLETFDNPLDDRRIDNCLLSLAIVKTSFRPKYPDKTLPEAFTYFMVSAGVIALKTSVSIPPMVFLFLREF